MYPEPERVLRRENSPAVAGAMLEFARLLLRSGAMYFRHDPSDAQFHAIARLVYFGAAYETTEPCGRVLFVLTPGGSRSLR